MKITKKKLNEIRKLALEASPGPWSYDDGNVGCGDGWGFGSWPTQYSGDTPVEYWEDKKIPPGIDSDKDSEYIAAVDPTTILALLDLLEDYMNHDSQI